jgi:hypothetical protein
MEVDERGVKSTNDGAGSANGTPGIGVKNGLVTPVCVDME